MQRVVGLLEFGFGLGGKSDDDIGAEGDIGDDLAEEGHFFKILLFRVDPVHLFQDAAGAGLNGEMDEFAERGKIADGLHELDGDVDRVGGHEADPLHAGDCVESVEKIVEKAVPFGLVFAVAIDVLAEQGDLFIALIDELFALFDDAFWGAGDFLAAGIGDDAIGAEFIAAADDRDEAP